MNNKEFQKLMIDTGLAIPDPGNPGKLMFNTGSSSTSPSSVGNSTIDIVESAEPAGLKTLAGLITALNTWKTNHASVVKPAYYPVMGGDGVPGIIIIY